MANIAKFYRAILDGLEYRGTSFLQCFTTCQPEHGVPDDAATIQANRIRDSRGMPEFVWNPALGETYAETLDLKGNPQPTRDWPEIKSKHSGQKFAYTVAHWASTEARFRRHFRRIDDATGLEALHELLMRVRQSDVVARRVLDPDHFTYVPDFGAYIEVEDSEGRVSTLAVSRQVVLFCIERRRSWRLLQSRAGIENPDYLAQRVIRGLLEEGELAPHELRDRIAAVLANGGFSNDLEAIKETLLQPQA
jgi:pyruvate-ferredoxin/flavodoxin oxidoreductase